MATITGTIKQNGTPVGAGWTLVYGDSGSGIKTTDSNGQFTWDDVANNFKAVLTFVVLDASGETKAGGSGTLIAAGGSTIFEV
tara:strand:+ start:652 stop:900 length:249 start_codon:yes stop_codon:yes gene_type:complete